MKKSNILITMKAFVLVLFSFSTLSCNSFLEIDPPGTALTGSSVFEDETTATAALINIYQDMSRSEQRPFQGEYSLSWMSGLMADEFDSYFNDNRAEFFEDRIVPENLIVQRNWNALYESIYTANMLIEQMEKEERLSQSFRDMIRGEARFIRALMYFYLVNFWENVPIALTTDYNRNRLLPQSSEGEVYDQIIEDLKIAQQLLTDQYPGGGRTRPNSFAVKALLSRVYLQTQQWEQAIQSTTEIINSGLYQLENDLDDVFLTASKEVIWHLEAVYPNVYTWDAYRFVLIAAPTRVTMSNTLLGAFDENDNRGIKWVGKFTAGSDDYYFPNKYKVRRIPNHPGAPSEHFVLFRLAEQYLVRAESRMMVGDLEGAKADLNLIRNRAGKISIEPNSSDMLKEAIFLERRLELFTEGFNRWMDLKRLGMVRTNLLPIPQNEIIRNPSLVQNPKY